MTDDPSVRASELTEAARNRLLHSAGLTIIANDDVCDELEGLGITGQDGWSDKLSPLGEQIRTHLQKEASK